MLRMLTMMIVAMAQRRGELFAELAESGWRSCWPINMRNPLLESFRTWCQNTSSWQINAHERANDGRRYSRCTDFCWQWVWKL